MSTIDIDFQRNEKSRLHVTVGMIFHLVDCLILLFYENNITKRIKEMKTTGTIRSANFRRSM